jgi:hypothetical protein
VTADLDFDKIREVRHTWQFYRDRRPETYSGLVRLKAFGVRCLGTAFTAAACRGRRQQAAGV